MHSEFFSCFDFGTDLIAGFLTLPNIYHQCAHNEKGSDSIDYRFYHEVH